MTRLVRRRYLALRVECGEPVDRRMVGDAVWNAVLRLFGEVGLSQAGLYLVQFDEHTMLAVLRCSHKALPMVKAAIASVTRIGNQLGVIHVLRVSGSLKALGKKTSGTKSAKRRQSQGM